MMLIFLMIRQPPRSPLVPYTTLFRPDPGPRVGGEVVGPEQAAGLGGEGGDRVGEPPFIEVARATLGDRKSTRLNSSHANISYAVFCLKKKKTSTLPTDSACEMFPSDG